MLATDFTDATLLLIGHGSTVNDDSAATVRHHAAEIRRRRVFSEVQEAFFKIEPRIGTVLASVRTARVFVVPVFVSEGYFTRQAIPCELGLPARAQELLPCVVEMGAFRLIYCPPVGSHPLMTEIILTRAKTALGVEPLISTALVIAGHGTELNPDSRKAIERQVELISARGLFAEVWPAFLEEQPRIADVTGLVKSPRVVVVPFFMSDGLHVREDIPVLLGEEASAVQRRLRAGEWPWVNPTEIRGKRIFYTPSVGSEPGIADVILERVGASAGL